MAEPVTGPPFPCCYILGEFWADCQRQIALQTDDTICNSNHRLRRSDSQRSVEAIFEISTVSWWQVARQFCGRDAYHREQHFLPQAQTQRLDLVHTACHRHGWPATCTGYRCQVCGQASVAVL